VKKKASKAKATCATTAGYVYQAWPKGKPIPKRKARKARRT
jgi:hypothetical protein